MHFAEEHCTAHPWAFRFSVALPLRLSSIYLKETRIIRLPIIFSHLYFNSFALLFKLNMLIFYSIFKVVISYIESFINFDFFEKFVACYIRSKIIEEIDIDIWLLLYRNNHILDFVLNGSGWRSHIFRILDMFCPSEWTNTNPSTFLYARSPPVSSVVPNRW